MYGAIIGDLAGSIYEYDQIKKVHPVEMDKLIPDNAFYSDDTILTVAIADAILHECDYEHYLRKYILEYGNYKPNFTPYFDRPFSPNTLKWAMSNGIGNSKGNGAMMRISPVAYMFHNEIDIIENAEDATIPSHNSDEAIECSTIIARLIFYFRKGMSKEEAFKLLNINNIEYIPFTKFNMTCKETINNCLYAIYNSNSFEDAIRLVLSMGGDTDTNACIVGSVCEALYGLKEEYINEVNNKIPDKMVKVLERGYQL